MALIKKKKLVFKIFGSFVLKGDPDFFVYFLSAVVSGRKACVRVLKQMQPKNDFKFCSYCDF